MPLAHKTEWSKSPPYRRVNGEFLDQYEAKSLYRATIQATEEAIINSLIAGESMIGINGSVVYSLPHDKLIEIMKKYNRIIR